MLVGPDEEVPEGYEVVYEDGGFRVAEPVNPPEEERRQEESESVLGKVFNWLTGRFENTKEALDQFKESFEEGTRDRRDIDDVMAAKNNEEQVERAKTAVENAGGVGVAMVKDTATTAMDLETAGAGGKLLREGAELAVKAGSKGKLDDAVRATGGVSGGAADEVLSIGQARALGGKNQGLIFVRENTGTPRSAAMRRAQNFESGTIGAISDVSSRQRAVPALRFNNPRSGGNNFVKFDGIRQDGEVIELIDAKTRIVPFSNRRGPFISDSVRAGLLNKSRALRENGPGFRGVLEFPNAAAAREAQSVLRTPGIRNLHVRVR